MPCSYSACLQHQMTRSTNTTHAHNNTHTSRATCSRRHTPTSSNRNATTPSASSSPSSLLARGTSASVAAAVRLLDALVVDVDMRALVDRVGVAGTASLASCTADDMRACTMCQSERTRHRHTYAQLIASAIQHAQCDVLPTDLHC
jgi:hypothetical protein